MTITARERKAMRIGASHEVDRLLDALEAAEARLKTEEVASVISVSVRRDEDAIPRHAWASSRVRRLHIRDEKELEAIEDWAAGLDRVGMGEEPTVSFTRRLSTTIRALWAELAECYCLSGADPDGNEDWRLAPYAVTEVRRLREESDEREATIARKDEVLRRLVVFLDGYQPLVAKLEQMAKEALSPNAGGV